MSKIDEMRRMREAQHGKSAPTAGAKVVPIRPEVSVIGAGSERTDEEQGKCAQCGKMKPLQNGLVAQHQKGLGKLCPGSRKAPA